MAERTEKKVYIEFLRIAACFLVIVNHTNSRIFLKLPPPSATWFASLAYFFVSKVAVPLFLMILGAVLLGKEDTPRRWRQRLIRGFTVFAIASAGCYIYYGWLWNKETSLGDFLFTLPFKPMTNAYWYLYLYLGILCMLPVLRKLVRALDARDFRWIFFLSLGVMGLAPLFRAFCPDFQISGFFTAALLGTRVAMVLFGYYLEHYTVPSRRRAVGGCILFPILIALQVASTYFLYRKDPENYLMLDDMECVAIFAAAVCVYEAARYFFTAVRLGERFRRGICYLGGLTFGIYLTAEPAINGTKQVFPALWDHMTGMLAMVLWELMIFFGCAAAAAVLKKLPGFRKLL